MSPRTLCCGDVKMWKAVLTCLSPCLPLKACFHPHLGLSRSSSLTPTGVSSQVLSHSRYFRLDFDLSSRMERWSRVKSTLGGLTEGKLRTAMIPSAQSESFQTPESVEAKASPATHSCRPQAPHLTNLGLPLHPPHSDKLPAWGSATAQPRSSP